ncbi:DUF3721 domain-containing protein [Synechococcus sp. JJ3a-Johnson]|uniref:DUF3721 domain-containing protein n=1 Tax=Synechococcus sp. JJ3a-Johnson TaxID=2823738 RepID=UPI0020CE1D2C|nr:DUF3721 domain-containing protein [Synechococcus sp. JJ3a-Johnson]MCP9830103.1 DUF3721 domain-containing protein [Synechococcus sp. JJ3a-Johnson]
MQDPQSQPTSATPSRWAAIICSIPFDVRPRGLRPRSAQCRSSPPTLTRPSKQVTRETAQELGCQGVHIMGSLWMPCEKHP